MIHYYEHFPTEQEAQVFYDQVLQHYHPCGYGTSLRLFKSDSGQWFVTGYRFSSCD